MITIGSLTLKRGNGTILFRSSTPNKSSYLTVSEAKKIHSALGDLIERMEKPRSKTDVSDL